MLEPSYNQCPGQTAETLSGRSTPALEGDVRGSDARRVRARDRYVAELTGRDQRAAAETVLRDWDDFVTFYHYPKEHWIHLRTTNPIESIFSGVRLRTNAAKRMRRRDNTLYLVFKIVQRLSRNWRTLNGGANLMTLVLEGREFKDGILQREKVAELAGVRS